MTAPASGGIVLVRHGETEWSRSGQHTSHTDLPLTDEGRRQATLVGQRLAPMRFGLVLTSPLARATETCALAGFGDRAVVTDDLAEWDYGNYEGRRTVDIRTEHPCWTLWDDGAPEGETATEVAARARRVLAVATPAGGDAVLFGHGHILRVLVACWLGRPAADGRFYALDAGSISVLGHEREQPVIVRWNDTGHLQP
ncbi:MAG: histidine phosphatase family protein [Acidimicrobiia bacterium]